MGSLSHLLVVNRYYQTIIYKALGITGHTNTLVAGIYNCVGPITNLFFITFLIDRVGRKKPLIFGAISISIVLACEAALYANNPTGSKHGESIGGVFFVFCVSILFSLSFGPISWYSKNRDPRKTGWLTTTGCTCPKSCLCRFAEKEMHSPQVLVTGW